MAAVLLLVVPAWSQESPDKVCATCHDQGEKLKTSAHVKMGCTGCHVKHKAYPHPEGAPKPTCVTCHSPQVRDYSMGVHGRAVRGGNQAAPSCSMCHSDVHETQLTRAEVFRKAVPETCGMCHDQVVAEFKASVHGIAVQRGIRNAPLCTDCHGEHSILPHQDLASTVSPGHVAETCAHCHDDVRLNRRLGLPTDRVTSFAASFHGLAGKSGSQTVANCSSCHGVHNILPSSNPKSMTAPGNLPATCGKCHPGAGSRFALGTVHDIEGAGQPNLVYWARVFYLTLIPVTIGLMLLHHGGDWIRKLYALRLNPKPAGAPRTRPLHREVRMYRSERIQHGLLLVSFFVLCWTGFALRYPDQWWARPLVAWEGSWPVRGWVHRIAGAVLIGLSVFHAAALAMNRGLREHWKSLLPVKADIYEGLAGLAYSLGLRRDKPVISPHSYMEKVEYWAVVWGTLIMGLTGVLLWAHNWTLQFLPKTWLDLAATVHFYEAILAALSILIWHLYSVIFDPDVYPLDTAFLTGVSVREREPHGAHGEGKGGGSK